ncbi:MAG TPA: PsbP-related protein [Solirubrobacteraceae bacterium]
MPSCRITVVAALAAAALAAAGCGSSSSSSGARPPAVGGAATESTPSALSAEARSAATGDIPDTQVFLTFTNSAARYSMKYPEGWTQSGSGADVTFQDKNNIVHVLVAPGPAATLASVTAALGKLKASTPSLTFTPPAQVRVGSAQAIKATYTTHSAPDPVTGRSVTLIVDRYVLRNGARNATVDLGTQRGVDNVDAYRMMIESFRWA